jgi:hypothetical protein
MHLELNEFHDTGFDNVFVYFEDDLCDNTNYKFLLLKIR